MCIYFVFIMFWSVARKINRTRLPERSEIPPDSWSRGKITHAGARDIPAQLCGTSFFAHCSWPKNVIIHARVSVVTKRVVNEIEQVEGSRASVPRSYCKRPSMTTYERRKDGYSSLVHVAEFITEDTTRLKKKRTPPRAPHVYTRSIHKTHTV